MNYIKDTKLITSPKDGVYNGLIEITKGDKIKYELKDKTFDELLPVRLGKYKYTFDYGCFPETLAGDKDPMDMVLLTNRKHKKLDIVEVELIGVLKTIDDGEIDDKLFVVDANEEITNVEKLKNKAIKFLSKYKGKKANMQILGFKDCTEAESLLNQSHKAFLNKPSTSKSDRVIKITL